VLIFGNIIIVPTGTLYHSNAKALFYTKKNWCLFFNYSEWLWTCRLNYYWRIMKFLSTIFGNRQIQKVLELITNVYVFLFRYKLW